MQNRFFFERKEIEEKSMHSEWRCSAIALQLLCHCFSSSTSFGVLFSHSDRGDLGE